MRRDGNPLGEVGRSRRNFLAVGLSAGLAAAFLRTPSALGFEDDALAGGGGVVEEDADGAADDGNNFALGGGEGEKGD